MPHDDLPAPEPAQGQVGVVYDVDGALPIAHLRRQAVRVRALFTRDPRDRRSLLGMPHLMRTLAADDARVFYLTAAPQRFTGSFTRFLRKDGYPAGAPLMCGRLLAPGWLIGMGATRKRAELDRLAERHPQLRWVLVGDDAGPDWPLYTDFARRHPGRVAAVAIRQAVGRPLGEPPAPDAFTLVTAPNGEEMLPPLRTCLRLDRQDESAVEDWFLTDVERGNDATRLRAWTTGNTVRPLIHGRTYFRALADALAATAAGDCVFFAGWRADSDELLTDRGPTVADALAGAARRGATVRGLLWRSHLSALGYHVDENRTFAAELADAGAVVLLDQRIRALGSHHQKLVVIRRTGDAPGDVAYVGGIDVDRGSRDDAEHHGDPQSVSCDEEYGPTPARHDVQVELRGPAVRDVEDAFRERWEDPAPLARLPWHVISDRVHGLPRAATPLPVAAADPPEAGRCAVQILRTYPRRRPPHPFAPLGERSIARGYIKALSRARRMVYIEDQYLWSVDVARIFAAALRRSPRLHLIAVVPRRVDQKVATRAAELGQAEAMAMVRDAGGDRVQIFDIERDGRPIYVHAKVCIVDDVWVAVGSNNLNTRSWTHDSELTAAILDETRDPADPADPAGLGDGARSFARRLRLDLMREHLARDRDTDLLDPDQAAQVVRRQAADLDAWYADGCRGPRPPGRLRRHTGGRQHLPRRHRWLTVPAYRLVLDPDGRPPGMRLRRAY